jgi:putative exporter of polyketide antibiotics
MLVNNKTFKTVFKQFSQNKALIVHMGIISLVFGLVIVITHNIWSGWSVIITVIGYLSVLKGIARLCFTDHVTQFIPRYTEKKSYYILCIIVLLLGLILTYFGFRKF